MRAALLLTVLVFSVASTASAQSMRFLGAASSSETAVPSTPTISDSSPLPSGTEDVAYTPYVFDECTGGVAPYTWTQPSGTLPTGMTFTGATRTLAGTPTVPGVYTFAIRCTDSTGGTPLSDTETFQVTVGYGSPVITNNAALAGGTEAVAYVGGSGVTLASTNGLAPYTYAVVSGALPPGLTLSGATINGTPTTAGLYAFTVRSTDSLGSPGTKDHTITVSAASSGNIAGTGPDDYFGAVRAWNGTSAGGGTLSVVGVPFKGATGVADTEAYGNPSTTNGHHYDGLGSVDATEVNTTRYVEDVLADQEVTGTWTSGELAVVFDEYMEPSFALGALMCMGSGQITTHKAWQIRQGSNSGSPTLGIEWRHGYSEGNIAGVTLTSITASGGTATATCSGACGFTEGENVTIAGATNQIPLTVQSTTTGTNPVATLTAPHGLTGTFPVLWAATGESPNLANPNSHFSGSVTGPSEITLTAQMPSPKTLTVGGTGGSLYVYPYSALSTPVHVVDATHFTYSIPSATYSSAATGTTLRAIDDDLSQATGTNCIGLDIRHYALITDITTVTDDQPLTPYTTAIVPCETWARYVVAVRFNAGPSWTCTSSVDASSVSGNYDLVSAYLVKQDGTKVRLFMDARLEFDRLTGIDPATGSSRNISRKTSNGVTQNTCDNSAYTSLTRASTGRIRSLWSELDSSAGGCYLGHAIPRRMYHRNWLIVHSSATGVIVPGDTPAPTLTVNGVEILRQPYP